MTRFAIDSTSSLDHQLREVVFQALGAASACWEDLRSGGRAFDSAQCVEVGDELLEEISRITGLSVPDRSDPEEVERWLSSSQ